MAERLEDLLRASTVRVLGGPTPGTGFFVAPGRVLTCVHVIGDAAVTALTVRWERDGREAASFPVTSVLALPGRGRPIPALGCDYPDIALLEVGGVEGHGCVLLDGRRPSDGDGLIVYGFPEEGGAVHLTPARLTYRGPHGVAPTSYWDLGFDTIKPGMSGSAVLNARTGGVGGIVVATKHPARTDGALAVPWEEVAAELQDLLADNRAFHQDDRRWNEAVLATAPGRPQTVIGRHGPIGTSRPGRQGRPNAAETRADSSRSEIGPWWPTELRPASNFSGRADELAQLDRWAADAGVSLIGMTGWGGAGKTALAANWVRELDGLQKRAGLRGVFGWSFYANSSADQWATSLLAWASNDLGIKLPEVKRMAARVLDLLRSVPLMLVLDGLEVVQRSPDDDEYGKFVDGILREVLTGACLIDHDGLILLTSRFPFADFEFFDGGRARMLELPPLTLGDGSALLAAAGGDWLPEDRRRELVGAVDGHAMAVSILAGLLAERPPASDVAALAADLLLAARTETRVNKVLEFYARRLVESDRYLLAAVCLFARPISVDALLAVSEHDAFGGRLAGWTPDMVESAVRNRLTGLVSWHPDGTVSVHPLVRDVFRPLVMGAARSAADATLAGIPEREVSSHPDALLVIEAIELLLDADHWESAEDLYKIRCGDGKVFKALPAPRLGQRAGLAFARIDNYGALTRSPFYDSAVGYFSMYTGDLAIALACQRRTVDRVRSHRDRQTSSAQYTYRGDSSSLSANIQVLSECYIYLGDVASARDAALAALSEAKYSEHPRRILDAHAWLGWLAGLAGDTNQAEEQFASADKIALVPDSDRPYDLIVARWAEWLLWTGRMVPARAIASYGLKASRKRGWSEEAARCEQVLGRLELSVGNTVKAKGHLVAAADCFQAGEHLVELVRTLVDLGACMQQARNLTDASRHADEAIAIAAPRRLALVQCSALALRAAIRADQADSSADRKMFLAGRDDADAALRLSVSHRLPWHELEAISAHARLDRAEGVDHGWGTRADALNARLIPAGLDPDPITEADSDLDALAARLSARLDERINEWQTRTNDW